MLLWDPPTKSLKVVLTSIFVFSSSTGDASVQLRRSSLLSDASEAFAQRPGTRADLVHFTQHGDPVTDRTMPIAIGNFAVTLIHPIHFFFNGYTSSLIVGYDIPMREIKERVPTMIGGGFPADQLRSGRRYDTLGPRLRTGFSATGNPSGNETARRDESTIANSTCSTVGCHWYLLDRSGIGHCSAFCTAEMRIHDTTAGNHFTQQEDALNVDITECLDYWCLIADCI